MHFHSSRQWALLLWGLLAAMGLCAPASAGVVVKMQALQIPGVSLSHVSLQLDTPPGQPPQLTLHADRVDMPVAGWRGVDFSLHGTLQRQGPQRWQLDAEVRLRHAPGGLLSAGHLQGRIDTGTNTLTVDASQGNAKISTHLPMDMPMHAQIHLAAVPMRWLQGVLSRSWHDGRLTAGRVSGGFAMDMLDNGVQLSGQFDLAKAGFDSKSGTMAGQAIDGGGRLHIDTSVHPTLIDLDATLRGGQLLLGPLYARLPDAPVRLSLDAHARDHGVELGHLHFDDPTALKLDGSMAFAGSGLERLHLTRFRAQLPAAYQRYGKAWLETKGLKSLKTDGSIDGSIDLAASGLRSFRLQAHHVDLGAGERLALKNLDGSVDWSRQGTRQATTLGWDRLDMYGIPNGAAQARLQSRDGTLQLVKPVQLAVLGGHLGIHALQWSPSSGKGKGQTFSTALTLTGVDLPKLCQAFGWPRFPGTLAGSIPHLDYADHRLQLGGGLSVNAFHGFVDVTRMTLGHPFGDSPELTADMHMSGLDLKSITSVFDFGTITGPLQGQVKNLHLVDWKPVAFDASLEAVKGGRISQRAVNNLTSVGGGGIAGGLQGLVLKLFSTFGYSKIELSCKLEGSVCRMGGIKPVNGGFLIVQGSGLPHLSVIGHERRVSWPTLISRLKAATTGGGPVVK